MKLKLFFYYLLLGSSAVHAQLYIGQGAQLCMTGNAQLTLQNTSLVNNGNFLTGIGTVSFTGNSSSSIGGSQNTAFSKAEINKTNNSTVQLLRMISVSNSVSFISGNVDLNGNVLDLGTTGMLTGEKESSRIIGANGGQVLFSTQLNNPVNTNPGNLGAFITSSKNLGTVLIKRGHKSQVNNYGNGNSMLRYYDIIPANNTNLDATLRFYYFDAELNGLTENSLRFWSSTDNLHWTNENFTLGNSNLNYMEKSGISSFSRWTLSSMNNALPVKFTLFNLSCNGTGITLNWRTAQEHNSHHFSIERSTNGSSWTVIGNVPAAGFSNQEKNYTYTDLSFVSNGYYRVTQYDADGKTAYTDIIRSSCGTPAELNAWPNPFTDRITVTVTSRTKSVLALKLFSSTGALVKKQEAVVLPGNNQLFLSTGELPAGIYVLSVGEENAGNSKTMKLVKK